MASPREPGMSGAETAGLNGGIKAWARDHARVAVTSLGRLYRTFGTSLMTAAVIGIALSLPAAMQVLVGNAREVSGSWVGSARISVYLKGNTSDAAAQTLAATVRHMDGVADVQYISADQALAEFKQLSGFGDAASVLDKNPLPAVLVVRPAAGSPESAEALQHQLAGNPAVDQVRLDMQWLKRLTAILDIVRRTTDILAALLGLAVIFVVGNTIRLEIGGRRTEIEVSKLLGATDPFIRRPFLYHGAWYGFAGGLIACILVAVAVALVAAPVSRLAGLYGSAYALQGLGFLGALGLIAGGALLGWAGSWLAVARHLRAIEPT
jgi:cell division transport system permease protein